MSKSTYGDGDEKVESFQEGGKIYLAAFGKRTEELLTKPEVYIKVATDFLKELLKN